MDLRGFDKRRLLNCGCGKRASDEILDFGWPLAVGEKGKRNRTKLLEYLCGGIFISR